MEPALILEWIIKSAFLLLFGTGGFAYLTLYERRALARIQTRIGPNRAGPFGILQPVADGIKLIFKEELIPAMADKVMFVLAPIVTVFPALVIWAVIPWGTSINLFGREIPLYLADVNVGVIYLTAVASIAVYGIVLAGWSSNNKYALMGGLRSSAQMISYEIALGLSFIGPIMLAGSMSLVDIVEAQNPWWYAIKQPLSFIIFLIAGLAEINRAPFDMPEAEQEITAGYHAEYSGMKFALFFMAEYIKMIAICAIAVTLFLGGYSLPFIGDTGGWGPLIFLGKVVILLFGVIWVRATLPRFRYDRLMAFGWKILLPLSLANVFITAVDFSLYRLDVKEKDMGLKIPERARVEQIAKGMWITFKSMFEKPVTIQYPEVKRHEHPRFRGRHVLNRYENGLEKCIGCSLCAAACPADAIFVEASENTDDERYSPGERYASTYEINMLRCIFCGYCEDACPTEAITLEGTYEMTYLSRWDALYPKDKLLLPVPEGGKDVPQKVEPGSFNRSIPMMEDPKD